MWKRFAENLRCVECRRALELRPIVERGASLSPHHLELGWQFGLTLAQFSTAVDAGLLICPSCKLWFPILQGLPIMLPYTTRIHDEFQAEHPAAIRNLGPQFQTPQTEPVPGEEFVLRSFSKEWLSYRFDGVLWSWTYEDRERLFLAEIGTERRPPQPATFMEIGCGIGLVTKFANDHFPGDSVGVDLSLAAMRAAIHFRDHPFLHFIQASLYRLPLCERQFDLVYSHGVLHHTYSTQEAFARISRYCKSGGRLYVWVYGSLANRETFSRRIAYAVEVFVRPIFSRLPPVLATIGLAPFSLLYMLLNRLQRATGRARQPYNFSRAMHTARDRLTPLYAFRHECEEVARWFREAGFVSLHRVTEREVPDSARDTVRRNIGMRGDLSTQKTS